MHINSLINKKLQDRWTVGIMSGTSIDGADLSAARFREDYRLAECCNWYSQFPASLKESLTEIASSGTVDKQNLMRADRELGLFYARSVRDFISSLEPGPGPIDLVGCHGQTVYHDSDVSIRSGKTSLTLQIGSVDLLAQRLGVPVVSDFRSADIAACGRGAPLTPIPHFHLLNLPSCRQLVVNIGGISNATYLAGTNKLLDVMATDCGPGNILSDQVCQRLFGKPYDERGTIASQGSVHDELLGVLKKMSFLRKRKPIALGREQFGNDLVDEIIDQAERLGVGVESVVSTVAWFTAHCIAAIARKVDTIDRILTCGGGSHNSFMINSLREMLPGTEIGDTSCLGIDPDYVESISFALLANLTVDRIPGNLPHVTGALQPVILGRISPV
jgi:anhydro-N-acetylmuramic acid kinase